MKYITFLFLLSLFCCTKQQEEICFKTFQFNIPLNITPQLDTFKIGDTMWLTSEISNKLEDLNGSELINVENFDFKIRIGFTQFNTEEFNVAEHHFDFINQVGEINQTSMINTNVIFEEKEDSKALPVGLVPKKIGGFYISFYNLRDDLQEVSLIDTNCIQFVDINYNMNDGNNNLHFIKESVSPANVTPIETLQKFGNFAFWVVE